MSTRLFFFTSLLLFTCSAAAALIGLMSREEPQKRLLSPDVDVFDVGEIPLQSSANATFRLRNDSGLMLDLIALQTDCGCASAEFKRSTLKPGQEVRATITIDSGTQARVLKHVGVVHYLVEGERKFRQLHLTIVGNVK